MTDWSSVQSGWLNTYDAYHYEMFPGYQQALPDAAPINAPVQQQIQEHQNSPAPQNLSMQNNFPAGHNLPPSSSMMQPQYMLDSQNMPMVENLPMSEEFPMTSHMQMDHNYTMADYLQVFPETYTIADPSASQNLVMSQNAMISPNLSSIEYAIDPASVPLPDDITMSQSVPMVQDVCMPQYVEQKQDYSMPSTSSLTMLLSSPPTMPPSSMAPPLLLPKPDNPREVRNKAEKQRRDKLNRSIADLAAMVPPVVAASRKIDKTGVLRLTAHYLRAHEYVFGDTLTHASHHQFKSSSMRAVMDLFNGFLLTVTYKGIIVVVSENVQQYLGYTELELLGHNILNITHPEDKEIMIKELKPTSTPLGPNGELLVPDEPDGIIKVTEALAREKRKFVVRLKKLGQRSEPDQYVTCHIEGSFRKSDKACSGPNRCCQVVRRARARSENHCSSGNDVVFIGMVRPRVETFMTEIGLDSFKMEYRTRHSIDGEIIQCEQRIALVTGYMINEVQGVNAMNFMHKDDVHWVIIALRDMYDKHRLFGESCYRLMTKNGDFIYMRTRGHLDVDKDSRVVTSFVCTNTVVDEIEGKYLIKMMKKKFNVKTKQVVELPKIENGEEEGKKDLPVEDPRQLEKVILHLVTNLPSQGENTITNKPAICGETSSRRLAIIPPKKERIVSAIEKIYTVIKKFPKGPRPDETQLAAIEDAAGKSVDDENIAETSQGSDKNLELICTEGSKLKEVDDEYLQKELNNSLQMPTTSLCLDPYFADFDLMTQPIAPETYDIMNALQVDSYSNGKYLDQLQEADQSAVEVKYEVLAAPELATNANTTDFKNSVLPVTLPSSSKSSLKRPIECLERNTTKKKLTNVQELAPENDVPADDDFSCLQALFDEAVLNKEIERAINTLEQTIDPTFPDLLISNEVQEILKEIEDEQDKDHANG